MLVINYSDVFILKEAVATCNNDKQDKKKEKKSTTKIVSVWEPIHLKSTDITNKY